MYTKEIIIFMLLMNSPSITDIWIMSAETISLYLWTLLNTLVVMIIYIFKIGNPCSLAQKLHFIGD